MFVFQLQSKPQRHDGITFGLSDLGGWKPVGGVHSYWDGMSAKYTPYGLDFSMLGNQVGNWFFAKVKGKLTPGQVEEGLGIYIRSMIRAFFPQAKAGGFSFSLFFFASPDGVLTSEQKNRAMLFDLFFTRLTTDSEVDRAMQKTLFGKNAPQDIVAEKANAYAANAMILARIVELLDLKQEDIELKKDSEGKVSVLIHNAMLGTIYLFNDLFAETKEGRMSIFKSLKTSAGEGASVAAKKGAKENPLAPFLNVARLAKEDKIEGAFTSVYGKDALEAFKALAQRIVREWFDAILAPAEETKIPKQLAQNQTEFLRTVLSELDKENREVRKRDRKIKEQEEGKA